MASRLFDDDTQLFTETTDSKVVQASAGFTVQMHRPFDAGADMYTAASQKADSPQVRMFSEKCGRQHEQYLQS